METLLTIGAFILFVVGPFLLIYAMDRRKKKKGPLFSGKPTRGLKILAVIIGLLFACVSLYEYFFTYEIQLIFPILAIALIGYGFGATDLLTGAQNRKEPTQASTDQPAVQPLGQDEMTLIPHSRFAQKIIVIIVISAIFLMGAYWAATHSDSPLAIAFVIGTLLLLVLARVFDWFRFFRNLFK